MDATPGTTLILRLPAVHALTIAHPLEFVKGFGGQFWIIHKTRKTLAFSPTNYYYFPMAMPPTQAFRTPRKSYILTTEDWNSILEDLSNGHSIAAATRKVGASRQVVYDRANRDPEFANAISEMTEEGIDIVEDWMLDKARDKGGFLANIAWLKAHRRAKWGDSQRVDVSITGQIDVFLVADAISSARAQGMVIDGECTIPALSAPDDGDISEDSAQAVADTMGNEGDSST